MGLRDLLHDRIDSREELALRAREIAAAVLKERLAEAFDRTDTFEEALTLIAAWTAKALDQLTTEAVRSGAAHALRRSKKLGADGKPV